MQLQNLLVDRMHLAESDGGAPLIFLFLFFFNPLSLQTEAGELVAQIPFVYGGWSTYM
jgi:hypothetical protein